jgi:hypothetical protein
MVQDFVERTSIAEEWHSLRSSEARLGGLSTATFGSGGHWIVQLYDDIFALLLLHGYSVLEHTLQQMGTEGLISYQGNKLGLLMDASRTPPGLWPNDGNYATVDEGKRARDDLAHRRVVPARAKTFEYLKAIEAALIHWKILDGPVEYTFTGSITRTS